MKRHILTILALIATVGSLTLPAAAQTREPDLRKVKVSLEGDGIDVRPLLSKVLKAGGVSFVIDQDVKGLVTIHLKDVSAEEALKQLLRQVNATYRVEEGIYRIVKGYAHTEKAQTRDTRGRSYEFGNADIREVLRTLCMVTGASFTINPEVQGRITLSIKDASVEKVLDMVLKEVDATYRLENGVYVIVKKGS
jgi:type II secretory pathway component GspD/PulD (secretin)